MPLLHTVNILKYLAHLKRISEILPWDRNLIFPMLSYPGRHCYVKVTSPCEIASKQIQGLLEAYFKIKKISKQEGHSGPGSLTSLYYVHQSYKLMGPLGRPIFGPSGII